MDIKTEYLNPNSDSLVRCTFFFFCHATWLAGFYFSDQRRNSCPLQWKHRILTTGPPGKSLVR